MSQQRHWPELHCQVTHPAILRRNRRSSPPLLGVAAAAAAGNNMVQRVEATATAVSGALLSRTVAVVVVAIVTMRTP